MTKQDILSMTTKREVMKALAEHRDLWDRETDRHLQDVAKKELLEKFGDTDVLWTPPQKST